MPGDFLWSRVASGLAPPGRALPAAPTSIMPSADARAALMRPLMSSSCSRRRRCSNSRCCSRRCWMKARHRRAYCGPGDEGWRNEKGPSPGAGHGSHLRREKLAARPPQLFHNPALLFQVFRVVPPLLEQALHIVPAPRRRHALQNVVHPRVQLHLALALQVELRATVGEVRQLGGRGRSVTPAPPPRGPHHTRALTPAASFSPW